SYPTNNSISTKFNRRRPLSKKKDSAGTSRRGWITGDKVRMASKDNARSELSEAAIAGMRQLAQDVPGTELISCHGVEARFKLPNPLQGSNGEGALVYYQGQWMAPPRFEELCGIKGKAWRRSFKVYTTFEDDEKDWLRMDMWLRQQKQGDKRGQGHVQVRLLGWQYG
ncbi:hypothetical protein DUNSADRAFT_13529, partial [Dunaliella salina]